jgi:lipopolysaccharide assembly outer membrane protein LptD (OstA)
MRGSLYARDFRALLLLIALVVCAPLAASGQSDAFAGLAESMRGEAFELTADELEFESARRLYIARGNVVIRQEERVLRADWIAFNEDTGTGVASGNVELVDGGDQLQAEFVEFNVRNLEGLIRRGTLESDDSQFRARGEEIVKAGGRRYAFEEGEFTSCRCPDEDAREPWKIRADEIDVEIEGYGTARNTTVDVLGVPLVWFPWMIYPIKTERQTGFLFPDAALGSRNGFEVGIPFFWAARDEVNATFTPRWTSKRGFKGDADFQYVYGEQSSGRVFGSYAYDQHIEPDSPATPFGRNRWTVLGQQDAFAPGEVRFQTDFRFVSDNEYPIDFDDLRGHVADRFLQSTASVGRPLGAGGRYGVFGAAAFRDDMQNPDDQDRDDYLLQRLPEVYATALPGPIAWLPILQPSIDADYTYFQPLGSARAERPTATLGPGFLDTGVDSLPDAQERGVSPDPHRDNAPGGTEGDGLFEEGEPLTDEGHRLLLHPRLAAPFQIGDAVEVYPEVGWHETLYDSRERGTQRRGFFTGRVDLRSRLRREFGEDWAHVLEPLIGYAFVAAGSQQDNPLFVPRTAIPLERLRTLDLDNVTRDPADRIGRANRVSFGFANRFHGRPIEGGPARLLADVTLLGLYEFEEREFGDVVLDGRAYPFRATKSRFNLSFDAEKARADEALVDFVWTHRGGHGVGIGYRFVREIPDTFEKFLFGDRWTNFKPIERVNQVNATLRFTVLSRWTLAYRNAYSFDQDLLIANQGIIEYMSRCGCWAAGVQLSDDRVRGVEIKFLYRLVGLGREIGSGAPGFLDGN